MLAIVSSIAIAGAAWALDGDSGSGSLAVGLPRECSNLIGSIETQAGASVAVDDIVLYDLDGSSGMLKDVYRGKNCLVIVGRYGCGNTRNAVSQISGMLEDPAYDAFSFLVMDCDRDRESFLQFASFQADRFHFCTGGDYNGWAFKTLGSHGSVTLPFMFAIDSSGNLLQSGTGAQNVRRFMASAFGDLVQDETVRTAEYRVRGFSDQESGRALLGMVNDARAAAGVSSLSWSEELERTAMQRAAELSVRYSHTRPNNDSCFTAWPNSDAMGENIAWGYSSSADANEGWTNSSGHYANMVRSSSTSMAAACFVAGNGTRYWVECFSSSPGGGFTTSAVREIRSYTVEAVGEFATFSIVERDGRDVEDLCVGDSLALYLAMGEGATLDNSTVDWATSDSDVAVVDAEGGVTAIAEGAATITASLNGRPGATASLSMTVHQDERHAIDRSWILNVDSSAYYTGKPIKVKPDVESPWLDNPYTLVLGRDYRLTYRNNVNAGTAEVTVTGIG
ncbi:MAG: Ig-like domain-containing protein, partial [Eggerthellaceae bacterium]|nr:Ig-like domain-containing protein [Eggerthellaceae bacterium]